MDWAAWTLYGIPGNGRGRAHRYTKQSNTVTTPTDTTMFAVQPPSGHPIETPISGIVSQRAVPETVFMMEVWWASWTTAPGATALIYNAHVLCILVRGSTPSMDP